MKATGITRKVDELGRIVLPKELRNVLEINEGDSMEIFTDGDRIVLKKYQHACLFCGDASDVILFRDKRICRACLYAMNEAAR